ncbi:porin family protein [candidate division TA06 bacterium]|uniref:Porin family protein n=1 Tax=candidate division TA06 bacterium TaxID=2250710 RepID=A0A523UUC2_UNCT6|nr:MAG: porin family protein [candidate division TA06 bacterium]
MSRLAGFGLAAVAIMVLASAASAQIGLGAGIHGGYAIYMIDSLSNGGMDFGINVNLSFMPMLSGQLFADYFMHSESENDVDTKYTDIPIGVHIIYNINIPGSPIKPYIGAGPSIHMLSTKTTVADNDTTVSSTKFGIGGVGGVEFSATPQLGVFLELRDHYILTSEDIEETDPVESTPNTNALYILVGVNYHFM